MGHPDANAGEHESTWGTEWTIRRVASTGSTNTDLLAEAGTAADRTVLIAAHQSAGRGRLNRQWEAPVGQNLLFSILFKTGFRPEAPHSLTRAVALGAVEAVGATTGVALRLKWPNDLLLDGLKVGGILAQATTAGGSMAVVVGLGLNIGWAPPEAARIVGTTPEAVLNRLLPAVHRLVGTDTTDAYRACLATLGQRVRVERTHDTIWGEAVDVHVDGSLVVMTETGPAIVTIGDVIHLRPGTDSGENC